MKSEALREQLMQAMRGGQAHIDLESALADFPPALRGKKPNGSLHTAWQLLEHMRIAQHDILEFSRNINHKSPKWPDEYWPLTDAPPDENAWDASLAAFFADQQQMEALISDPLQDLFHPIEGGDGQTLLREAMLVACHSSYHLGQLMLIKKMT